MEEKEKPWVTPQCTTEEFDLMRNAEIDSAGNFVNPEIAGLVARKGIVLNSGGMDILVDGKRVVMNTDARDFGTVIVPN